ncbi:nucleotidyltransferase domain-containing protein [Oceanobacillus sp. J11TS1]|uniref:type VII toxin-antitoxin system MntA family adenylyltransferase antitoxin n=1 Tax=Oceanobacillus sp. J11TS1 TaxID=2807191 RepID=UPI001B0B6F6A|nr:nucleotidyltransferase domain-containing protein [Oceanobacillus sp. J11TS1]GIO23284.1 nucleotidyltransferase [Oceanobacillus sp. J11TS1]
MQQELVKQIEDFLVAKFNPTFILIFGSFAKGTHHKESDLDIAFQCKNASPSAYDIFIAAQELADIVKINVDLIHLKDASTVFQAQIYSSALLIYTQDKDYFYQQRMTALSSYVKLNEERQTILEKIREEGSVYGE